MRVSVTPMSTVFKMCIKKDIEQVWKMTAQHGSFEYQEERRCNKVLQHRLQWLLPWRAVTNPRQTGDITALCDGAACFQADELICEEIWKLCLEKTQTNTQVFLKDVCSLRSFIFIHLAADSEACLFH